MAFVLCYVELAFCSLSGTRLGCFPFQVKRPSARRPPRVPPPRSWGQPADTIGGTSACNQFGKSGNSRQGHWACSCDLASPQSPVQPARSDGPVLWVQTPRESTQRAATQHARLRIVALSCRSRTTPMMGLAALWPSRPHRHD